MKSIEELNALKEEVETLNKKLAELTDEELAQVSGGGNFADLEQMTNVPEQYSASKNSIRLVNDNHSQNK